jgi:hypothetical protein
LDAKPTFPEGFPTRRTIALAGQVATHLCHGLPENSGGQQRGNLIGLCRHYCEQIRIEDFVRWAFRFKTGKIAQLQQTNCQW